MFGMAATSSDPIASYEKMEDAIYRNQKPGTRGYVSKPDSALISPTGSNNDLVFTSKGVRPKVGSIRVQYGIVGPTFPALRLYEGGTPATLALSPSQGYQLVTTFPGLRGDTISLTVVDRGVPGPLSIRAVPTGDIIVYLARDSSAVTTVAADLVNLINVTPGVNRWVQAWVADSSKTDPLTAIPKTSFRGGSDDPYLVYIAVVANTSSVVSTTATQIKNLMVGSALVTAALSGSDNGSTAVTVMGPVALTGGILSGGEILQSDARVMEENRLLTTIGQGENHQTNYGIEVEADRQGASRTWKSVPQEDHTITASSSINHQMEHKPRSLFL